jgi:hypothetical protein
MSDLQAAMMNPQALQNYYAQLQLYGLASPTAPPPYHHQYVGYMPTPSPRAVLSPAQQLAAPPYVPLAAAAQMHGSFVQVPSLPHNFALQLPPHAVAMLPPNPTGMTCLAQVQFSSIFLLTLYGDSEGFLLQCE